VTTDPTTEPATPTPTGIRRLGATLSGAGGAARQRLQHLRGRHQPAVDVPVAPGPPAAEDGLVAEAAPPAQRTGIGLWRAIMRAKLVVVVTLALVQVAVALISWRVRGSRARRRGQPVEDEALEALGETLGGLAGSVDASRDL
jgi:hypothetical protein